MSKLARASAIAAAVAIGSVSAAGGTDATSGRLRPFGSCGALVAYAKQHASQVVSRGVPPGVAAPAADGRAAGADFSTTNVQEAGVDEPDIVKTDGSHLFVVAAGTLYVVDARASRPRVLGSLRLEGSSQELLLFKRRLLVLARASVGIEPLPGRPGMAPYLPTQTILSEVDVAD